MGNDHSQGGARLILSLQWTYGGKPWGFLNINALLPLNILELRISLYVYGLRNIDIKSSHDMTNDWFQVKLFYGKSSFLN